MWRAVLTMAAIGLVACSGPPPPTLSVKVYQTRSDTPLDKIEIQVRNDGRDPITVQRAELHSERLRSVAVWGRPVQVPPGFAMDLKVQLPDPVCDGDAGDEVLLQVDGRQTRVPATDPLGQLSEYVDRRCFEQAVTETAELEVLGVISDGLQVMVSPGAAEIGVTGTTTLFRPVDPRALAAQPGRAAAVRPLALMPNRCDAHALAEDKQGTFVPVQATLPDGRTGAYPLTVSGEQRADLYRLYARQCDLR